VRLRRLNSEWRDLRIIDASDSVSVPGLSAIAARVALGVLGRSSPVVVGVHPLGGGYPDAIVACPIDRATALAVMRGDASTLADCLELLDDALEQFRHDLRLGRLN